MTEQMTLRVSVIIPTYNRAAYLREALESVLAQSSPPWEIIVVDDGSTDDTPDVVQAYGSRVHYVRHAQNQRIAAARNSGLNAARGDAIAWLDSDDLWEPDFLATVMPLLAQDDTLDGVYTGLTMIDAEGRELRVSTHVEPPDALYDALVRDCFLVTPSIVVRKACYDQVGGFDPRFRISEDYDMWLRLSSQFTIIGIPQPLVRIRVHPSNTMRDMDTLCQARLALAEKHFGRFEADGRNLTDASRSAYGYAFRSMANQYVENGQPDEGWRLLEQAVALNPAILERLDTFYELAFGDQPRGYRGDAEKLDIPAVGADLIARLEALFVGAPEPVQALRPVALGNAYVTLAMLGDQAGRWDAARRYLWHAFRADPGLMGSWPLIRRWLKLCGGQRLAGAVQARHR